MQRRAIAIQPVEVTHQRAHAFVQRRTTQVPIERAVFAPFARLGKLLPHEQQLLARIAPHHRIIGAQIGELLPRVAGHLGKQAAFAMHHLVMA